MSPFVAFTSARVITVVAIVAGCLVDRTDAHQTLGIRLQAIDDPPSRGGSRPRSASGRRAPRARARARVARHACGGELFERLERLAVRDQRLDRGELLANGSPRSTAPRSETAVKASRPPCRRRP